MFVYYILSGIGFLCIFSALPLVTGYCAASYGRPFWLWFTLGWLLPFVSFSILVALIARRELNPSERLLTEAKAILAAAEAKELLMKNEE